MNRCSVCGAASREGAKFCTSCGTRLEDAAEDRIEEQSDEAIANDAGADRPETLDTEAQPVIEPSDASERSGVESDDAEADGERDAGGATETDEHHYASSWPESESTNGDEDVSDREDVLTAESPNDVAADSRDHAESFADTDDIATWPETSVDEPVTGAPPTSLAPETGRDSDVPSESGGDEDHHDASDWESWAPVASGPSITSNAVDEHLDNVYRLIDELKQRVERMGRPASLASRDLDPDDLADQLDRWSRAVPDNDDLLEAVKQVRRSPRDLDALMQLADRAPDLELLVRHYQSITSTSDQWAADLRRQREDSGGT